MNHFKKIILAFLISLPLFAQVTNKETLFKHVSFLASDTLEGRGLGTKGKIIARDYIIHHFDQAGIKLWKESRIQEFPVKAGIAWVDGHNVLGVIEGTDPNLKNEFILIGAHYDHIGYRITDEGKKIIFPGADDNASGVATIIELAKFFQKNPTKRSLLFIAFDAEESGLLGAEHFAKSLTDNEKASIKKMFSFDMVGMLEANKGLILKGIASLDKGKETAQKIGLTSGIELQQLNAKLEERTDTYPFGKRGIPSTHVFTGLKSPYHRPEDKADLLDYSGMVKVADFSSKLITDLANEPILKGSTQMEEARITQEKPKEIFSFGLIMSHGSGRHIYREEFYDAKFVYNFNAGLQMNAKLNKYFNLQLEALYDYNGSRSAAGRFTRNSVTIPVNLELGTPTDETDGARLFIFGGPYFRHNLNGTNGSESLDFENDFRKDEWGLSTGIGLDFGKLRIAYTTRRSFSSVTQSGPNLIPQGRFFTLGYRF